MSIWRKSDALCEAFASSAFLVNPSKIALAEIQTGKA